MRPRRDPLLLVLAFTGGVVSLGLEIAASRLLAPFFGTSTLIWGALIGLILLYLTVGYYVGGWAADRWPRPQYLYRISALAGAVVLLIPPLSRPILLFSQSAQAQFSVGGFVGALVGVLLLFSVPVVLLGMLSPYVIRLRVQTVEGAGQAAGAVYALSTAGSILGAFLPAFWWIPSYGTRATIYGLGAVMLVISILGMIALRAIPAWLLLTVALCVVLAVALPLGPVRPAADGNLVYESESEYGYIQVVQKGPERDLILNEGHAIHSIYDPNRVLAAAYWDYVLFAPLYGERRWDGQKPGSALVIGLAGGTIARELTATYGPLPIDGVEIDPRIIDVGRRYFAMTEPNLHAITADGRYFLDTHDTRYDVIIMDAYRQPYIPFHLTTKEFFQECRRHLTPHGVVVANVGRGPNADYRLVDAVTGTLSDVFSEVYQQDTPPTYLNTVIFAPNQPTQPAEVDANFARAQTSEITLLATAVDEVASAGTPPRQVHPHLPVYTDDLAPVERLIDSMVLRAIQNP